MLYEKQQILCGLNHSKSQESKRAGLRCLISIMAKPFNFLGSVSSAGNKLSFKSGDGDEFSQVRR